MNGAITVPCVNTIRVPNKTMVIISGANQYFFLTLRKSQISINNSSRAVKIKNSLKLILYPNLCYLKLTLFVVILFFYSYQYESLLEIQIIHFLKYRIYPQF